MRVTPPPDTGVDNSGDTREIIPSSAATDLCINPTIDGITTTKDGTTYIFKGKPVMNCA